MQYEIKPLTEEDGTYIEKKIGEYAYLMSPPEPGTPEEEQLILRAEDENGNFAGGCAVNVHEWRRAVLAQLWVEEPHRKHGLGSYLLREVEREAKEKGAYVLFTYGCDWVVDFFHRNGYTARGALADYPKDHTAYELEKRI